MSKLIYENDGCTVTQYCGRDRGDGEDRRRVAIDDKLWAQMEGRADMLRQEFLVMVRDLYLLHLEEIKKLP